MSRVLTLLAVAVITSAQSLVAQDPPAYIVAAVTINDMDTYRQYQRGFGAILSRSKMASSPTALCATIVDT